MPEKFESPSHDLVFDILEACATLHFTVHHKIKPMNSEYVSQIMHVKDLPPDSTQLIQIKTNSGDWENENAVQRTKRGGHP